MEMLNDCETCMKCNPREIRQQMGCGYEPPVERPMSVWKPPGGEAGYRHDDPTVCPGYTTKLPQVLEVAMMHAHESRGSLALACPHPTEELMHGLVILDGARHAVERYRTTPVEEGGGRG